MSVKTRASGRPRRPFAGDSTRRQFIRRGGGAVAGVSLLGFAACGGGSGEDADSLLFGIAPDFESIVKSQLAAYNKQHPGAPEISTRVYPVDTSQYFDRLRTQLQAGSSVPDVFVGDVTWPAQFAANGWVADLSGRLPQSEREQFLAGAIAGDTVDGKVYAVPWYTDSGLLYYRKDLLEKAGYGSPPATWDGLREIAAKVMVDAGVEDGFVYTGAIYEGGTLLGTEFIRCSGGDILDGGKVVVSSPEAIRGLTIQQSLVADGIAPKAVANYKEDEATAAFLQGNAVFMRQWPYAYDFITDKEQSKLEVGQVGLTQVPVAEQGIPPTNVGGGWSFFLSADSGNADAAWELISYLSAAAQQKQMALEGSYLPTRTALYEDPQIIAKLPAVRLGGAAVENTTTPPVSPYYSDMSSAMSRQFNANILGSSPPEQIAEKLQDELTSIVERGG